uniref:Uncharacterized protein n=1 Tax=Romanomermis culicivorax TaxID=13658 RepID=A0A915KXL3_ROMCU
MRCHETFGTSGSCRIRRREARQFHRRKSHVAPLLEFGSYPTVECGSFHIYVLG